jgi:hypothetical protein
MHRVGKLPPRLAAQLARALERGINRPALEEAIGLAASLRLAELGRPLPRLFNPRSVRLVSNLAEDFGTIGRAGGVRAMKLSLEAADSTADVRRLARVADTYGDRFVGVMKLVGRGALRLGHLLFTIVGWLVGAALWAWSMLAFILNAITSTDRFFRRRARARRAKSKASFRKRADAVHFHGAGRSSAFIRVAESRMKSGSSVAVTSAPQRLPLCACL